jgi:hypothetical protein
MHRRGLLPAAAGGIVAASGGLAAPPDRVLQGLQAWRKNVAGVVKAPFPVLWDVAKS